MPTYEYLCRTCGHRFEVLQSINADPLAHCPVKECVQEDESLKGTGEVTRLVSGGAGLVFKGEGFYLTDYARKGKGEESGKSSTSTPSSPKSASSGSSPEGSAGSSQAGGSSPEGGSSGSGPSTGGGSSTGSSTGGGSSA
ncbi:MAG: hypothetical protein JST22_19135 [Bacteroidetes bacterium]|nr:hypothetical protein [Bacteroidota bacterium]